MTTVTGRLPGPGVLRDPRLLNLALGHFMVDCFTGLLPVMYPLLIVRYGVNLGTVALVTLAYAGVGSLSQPGFGWLADRYGTRFTGVTMLWSAMMFTAIAFAPSFPATVALAAVAGLGSGCFHPLGAVNVSQILDPRSRNTGMSIYVSGGTLGIAFGPLIGVGLFALFGLHGLVLMLIPGALVGGFLLWQLRHLGRSVRQPGSLSLRRVAWVPLAAVVMVMMSRNWVVSGIETFIPTWYRQLGYSPVFYGALATTVVLASAAGSLGTGAFADRHGRKAVIIALLAASVPVLLLFAAFTGPIGFLTGAAVGLLAASTGPLMLVMAQQLLAARAGLASGAVLGIGFVAAAVGVPITGAIGDRFGLRVAIAAMAVITALTLPVALLLPGDRFLAGRSGDAVGAEPKSAPPRAAAGPG